MNHYLARIVITASKIFLRMFNKKRIHDKFESSDVYSDNQDYSDYKAYVYDADDREDVYLKPIGFKKLIEEALSPVIEKEFGMQYLGNGYWASDYENHCRKVIRLFSVNSAYATLCWGYNFDFIPKKSGERLVYSRTDKSVCCHIFEVSDDFIQNTKNREKTILSAFGGNINDFNHSISTMKRMYADAFDYLLPVIQKYYDKTATLKEIIADTEQKYCDTYYRLVNPDIRIVLDFFIAFYGNKDEALKDFAEVHFESDGIRQKFLSKLKKVEAYGKMA